MSLAIRAAEKADWPAIWSMLEPAFRDGETYAVDPEISEAAARTMWLDVPKATFVAETAGEVLGTYYLKANQAGHGNHICNCGYVTAEAARGQGIAAAMCTHSLDAARDLGFTGMQYNLVISTNVGAIRLWQRMGFDIVGTIPDAFRHPVQGLVAAHVMYRGL